MREKAPKEEGTNCATPEKEKGKQPEREANCRDCLCISLSLGSCELAKEEICILCCYFVVSSYAMALVDEFATTAAMGISPDEDDLVPSWCWRR